MDQLCFCLCDTSFGFRALPVRLSGRWFGLHCGDGARQLCAGRDQTNGHRPKRASRSGRFRPLLPRWTPL